jgi:hypothetical protein
MRVHWASVRSVGYRCLDIPVPYHRSHFPDRLSGGGDFGTYTYLHWDDFVAEVSTQIGGCLEYGTFNIASSQLASFFASHFLEGVAMGALSWEAAVSAAVIGCGLYELGIDVSTMEDGASWVEGLVSSGISSIDDLWDWLWGWW